MRLSRWLTLFTHFPRGFRKSCDRLVFLAAPQYRSPKISIFSTTKKGRKSGTDTNQKARLAQWMSYETYNNNLSLLFLWLRQFLYECCWDWGWLSYVQYTRESGCSRRTHWLLVIWIINHTRCTTHTPRKEDGLKRRNRKFEGSSLFFPYAQRILRRQLNSWSLFSRVSGLVYIHTNIYKGKHSPLLFILEKKRTSRGGGRVSCRFSDSKKKIKIFQEIKYHHSTSVHIKTAAGSTVALYTLVWCVIPYKLLSWLHPPFFPYQL